MKKIISYSLWGADPKYCVGALRNAELIPKIYPGWIGRFYIGRSVPQQLVPALQGLGAETVLMEEDGDWRGLMWRFFAASDPDVAIMLSRDCDSRLNVREAAAVQEWLRSEKNFHIMRDHPAHTTAILGGMWGVRAPCLRNMMELLATFQTGNYWQTDQEFLRLLVYPLVRDNAMVHDPFFEKKPFPLPRQGTEFVGDVFNHLNERHPEFWRDIANHDRQKC
jgi:hypothetical protein